VEITAMYESLKSKYNAEAELSRTLRSLLRNIGIDKDALTKEVEVWEISGAKKDRDLEDLARQVDDLKVSVQNLTEGRKRPPLVSVLRAG
jgi:hypothetical protein